MCKAIVLPVAGPLLVGLTLSSVGIRRVFRQSQVFDGGLGMCKLLGLILRKALGMCIAPLALRLATRVCIYVVRPCAHCKQLT